MIQFSQTINYTLEELCKIVNATIPVPLFDGKQAFEILDDIPLPGEIFRKIKYRYDNQIILEASNFGRIKFNGKVLPQHEKDKESNGYLVADVPSPYPALVYQLVADAWLEKPSDNNDNNLEIHHINNNGYDNRPQNLIFVLKEQHTKIHTQTK